MQSTLKSIEYDHHHPKYLSYNDQHRKNNKTVIDDPLTININCTTPSQPLQGQLIPEVEHDVKIEQEGDETLTDPSEMASEELELESESESEAEASILEAQESDVEADETDLDSDSDDADDDLLLDKDIEIRNVLRKKGYRKLTKLVTTDQGAVWKAKAPRKYGKIDVVIKIASKLHYQKCDDVDDSENMLKEIDILRILNNEQKSASCEFIQHSIVNLIDTIDDMVTNNYMMILEDGGMDLFNFTKEIHQEISAGKITINEWKKTVRLIGKKLIHLIHWLHDEMSLCHLDISLENILISNINWITYPDQNKQWKKKLSTDFELKLIDFGACKQFQGKSFECNTICGKPSYCTPQIYNLQKKISNKSFDARHADVWSFGVSMFIMCIGCPPWSVPDERNDARFQTIVLMKNIDFLLNAWKRKHFMDENMKDILSKIFVMAEKDRISTKEIIEHSWLCSVE